MHQCYGPTMHDIRQMLNELHRGRDTGHCSFAGRCGSSAGPAAAAFAAFLHGKRIDFYQSDEAYFAYVNVQGLDTSSLKIKIEGGRLVVLKSAPADAPGPSNAAPSADWVVLGSYDLPEDAVQAGIFAKLEDGELFLSVPRTTPEAAIEVPIETSSAPGEEWVDVARKDSAAEADVDKEK